MGRVSDDPGLDSSRSAPAYGDPTGEQAIRSAMCGPMMDWKIVGPRLVVQNTVVRGLGDGEDVSRAMLMPTTSDRPIQLNLMPEVAKAVLNLLLEIAEPAPSRSGGSRTFRLKKAPGAGRRR